MKIKVLFVCSGNICRSPSAEAIFTKLVKKRGLSSNFEIDSAGTSGWHVGEPPDPRMHAHAQQRGYPLSGVSRQFKAKFDFDHYDYVIGMDDSNIRELKSMARDKTDRSKIYRMTDFSREYTYDEVPDPYYGGEAGFELVLDILEDSCRGFLETISDAGS